jgi:peptidoglycan/LPS O-acetylase OafA/YrhL
MKILVTGALQVAIESMKESDGFEKTSNIAKPGFRLGYLPVLDGVRGLSILAVMFHHGYLFWFGQGGFLGVDIFFVLSGFLITSLLVQEWEFTRTINFRAFYRRRALRLFPGLAALLFITLVFSLACPPQEGQTAVLKSVAAAALYVANWYEPVHLLGHAWSLSLEEQFYFIWPIIFFIFHKAGVSKGKIIGFLIAVISLIAIRRAYVFHALYGFQPTEFHFRAYTGTDMRMDAILVGCLVGLLFAWGMIPETKRAMIFWRVAAIISTIFLLVLVLSTPLTASHLYYGVFTLVAAAVGLVVVGLTMASPPPALSAILKLPALVWIGKLSYSLYLWHMLVYTLYDLAVPQLQTRSYTVNQVMPLFIKIVLSIGAACLSYNLIERPFRNLKRRSATI